MFEAHGELMTNPPSTAHWAESKLLIVEPDHRGHRLRYVRTLLAASDALSIATKVVLDRGSKGSPEFAAFMSEPPSSVAIEFDDLGDRGALRRVIKLHGRARYRVVILDADRYLLHLFLLKTPMYLLIMRPENLTKFTSLRGIAKLAAIGMLNLRHETHFRRLSGTDAGNGGPMPLRLIPPVRDPAPLPVQPDQRMLLDLEPSYLLVAGRLDARKSVGQLVDWALNTALVDAPILILAGILDVESELKEKLHRGIRSGRIKLFNEFVSESRMAALYKQCFAVACLYENQGPSGSVAYAQAYKRPIIVWNNRTLLAQAGEHVFTFSLPDRSVASLDQAVEHIRRNGVSEPTEPDSNIDLEFGAKILGLSRVAPVNL